MAISLKQARIDKGSKKHVPDGIASAETDPLWNWAVLLLRFGEFLLRAEGLVRLRSFDSVSIEGRMSR